MTPFLRSRRALVVLVVPVVALTFVGARAFSRVPTAADAVLEVEQHWLTAEFTGDTAYLHEMLLPEYRTVSSRGVRGRDGILASALKHAANHDAVPTTSHPPEVEIHGSTAISTFVRPDTSASADVFVLEHGRWHALYSQHTELKPSTEQH